MTNRASVVVTTINDGSFLDKYANQIVQEQALDTVEIIVIPDRKTPAQIFERCEVLEKRGIRISRPTLEEQDAFIKKLNLSHIIPHNSDNRRNIGFLMALENGCDFLISIDDDNFCRDDEPFFAEHAIVCQPEIEFDSVNTSNGWFNICDLMVVEPSNTYPRGFPYYARYQPSEIKVSQESGSVHLNAGLWLGDPDLDAITWLAMRPRSQSFKGASTVLGRDTWSPINTQNTALNREAIVAYYFLRMGYPMAGMQIDRYGDIFSGYFSQACVRHLGFRIRVGTPIANHMRNSHNYLRDLTNELACIWLIEDLSAWLREVNLDGTTYASSYLSLASALDDAAEEFSGFIWNDSTRGYVHQMAYCMRAWVKAVKTIEGTANV